MPYVRVWQEPELLLEHAGVRVYAAYGDDDAEDQLSQWFTTDPSPGGGDGPFSFRWDELAVSQEGPPVEIVRRAIDAGLIRVPGGDAPAPV